MVSISMPKCQEMGPCAKFLFLVSLCLFVGGLIEIVVLFTYISSFKASISEGCCGVLDAAGSVCSRDDIQNGNMDKIDVNGSILCAANGVLCENYLHKEYITGLKYNVTNTTLRECFDEYDLLDACGSDGIQQKIEKSGTKDAINWCYTSIIIFLISSSILCCDLFGCFKDCSDINKWASLCYLKMCEVIAWIILLISLQLEVENVLENGYENVYLVMDKSPFKNSLIGCETVDETEGILWIDYDITVPEWLNAPIFGRIALIGVILTLIDALFACCDLCGLGPMATDEAYNLWRNRNNSV